MRSTSSPSPADLALAKEFVHRLAEEDCRQAGEMRRKVILFAGTWDFTNIQKEGRNDL